MDEVLRRRISDSTRGLVPYESQCVDMYIDELYMLFTLYTYITLVRRIDRAKSG